MILQTLLRTIKNIAIKKRFYSLTTCCVCLKALRTVKSSLNIKTQSCLLVFPGFKVKLPELIISE